MLKPTPRAIKRHFRGGFALYFNRVPTPKTEYNFLVVLEHQTDRQRAKITISGTTFAQSARKVPEKIIRVRSPVFY